ncbi:MAG: SGNH/GDSL hydrolase family protein [Acidaminococcus sp.]|uniref:SGNH/GDSL hydrolase family protein n=1 Tax=Acidaminococcus sp. TaxID=1872103 RepID=UPI003F1552EE
MKSLYTRTLRLSLLLALAGSSFAWAAAPLPAARPIPAVTTGTPAATATAAKTPNNAKTASPILRRQPVPVFTTHYTREKPASLTSTLRWKPVLGTVYYNVKVTLPNGTSQPDERTYVAGYNLGLPQGTKGDVKVQIQSFNLDEQPISDPSAVEDVYVDPDKKHALYPVPISKFNSGNGTTLLYPVYNWVPLHGIRNYEVEVLNTNKVSPFREAEEDQLLERGKSTGFDWYDDESHTAPYTMYWRVRAMDDKGNPVGQFCPPQPMRCNPEDNWQVATLGDSISHGGGDLSYSPSDFSYSYQYYLPFDSVNLAESGDTSEATLARFDKDVVPFHPTYLIIMTGSNSLRGWTSGESVISDLKSIQQKCEDNGIIPIFMTLPPVNPANIKKAFDEPTAENWMDEMAKVNQWIRSLPWYIDLGTKFNENEELPTKYALDGLHLNFRGKRLMAAAISEQWKGIMQKIQDAASAANEDGQSESDDSDGD